MSFPSVPVERHASLPRPRAGADGATVRLSRERYDALVFDLDGTLLDGAGAVTPATRREVARARALGFLVLLATGRSVAGAAEAHAALDLDTDIVAYNGAWIGPRDGGTPWHYATIPDDLVAHLRPVESRAAFHFRHHRASKYTAPTPHPDHARVMAWFRNVVAVDPEAAGLPSAELLRVSLFYASMEESHAAWDDLTEDARARLHREVFPLALFPEFEDVGLVLTEVQRKGRGKSEALRLLAERHGVPPERVVAVGDQHNDLPLLRDAGLAVVMGNGVPAAKALADVVVGDHREDGVARFLATALA